MKKTKYNLELYKLKSRLCKTLADPVRLMIIQELRDGERSVSDIQTALEIPQAAVSRHLAILRDAGVVLTRREKTNIYYRLTDFKICQACDMVNDILISQIETNRNLVMKLVGQTKTEGI